MAAAGANSQLNPLENAKRQFDEAAASWASPRARRRCSRSRRTTIQHLPVVMDDGRSRFTGYRCQHFDRAGPRRAASGSTRDVTIEGSRGARPWMTWKCAVADIPFGGGRAASWWIRASSRRVSWRLTRRYAADLSDIFGPDSDVPAP